MGIEQIQTAIHEGIPFEIETAAGCRFTVTSPERIVVVPGRGAIVLVTEDDLVHVIPFLTMTSLTYLKPEAS